MTSASHKQLEYTIANQLYDVVRPNQELLSSFTSSQDAAPNKVSNSNSTVTEPQVIPLTPIVVTKSELPPSWKLLKLENGAYHIIVPGLSGEEHLVASSGNMLYAISALPSKASELFTGPGDALEWEVLSTARGDAPPSSDKLDGIYMIAARGQPRMVWTLLDGDEGTQVQVIDLFTANAADNAEEISLGNAIRHEPGKPRWKPRRWLWCIEPSKAPTPI